METYAARISRVQPAFGDLLYSREGTYFGSAAEVPSGLPVCLGQRMVLIRPNSDMINHRFLRFWLNSGAMASYVQAHKDGSVAQRLNLPVIRSIPVPLPPRDEQDDIAETLGALDDKIESNLRQRALLRALGLARLDAARAASPSVSKTLSEVSLSIVRGVTPKYADGDQSAPVVVNQKCIRGGLVTLASARRMVDREVAATKKAESGDVLVNSTGVGTLGRVGRWHRGSLFVDGHISVVKPNREAIEPTVLAYAMFEREGNIESLATGSTGQTELSPARLGSLVLELPGKEQAAVLEPVLLAIEDRIDQLGREVPRLKALRDALLPELLSGRIRRPVEAVA
ncbi:restriction endonuclease subunit S [Leifsonia sp. NPDC056665]|uniref:restriction endonuclease subunit S n=1 Tax=Leifsonia sp. NPDC056665 TaxID=3345901 RepID=UPI00369FE766